MANEYTHDDLRAIIKDRGLNIRVSDKDEINDVIAKINTASEEMARSASSQAKSVKLHKNAPKGLSQPECFGHYGKPLDKKLKCITCWYAVECKKV